MTNYTYRWKLSLYDYNKDVAMTDTNAFMFVCTAGTPNLATLVDDNGNALNNPLTGTNGVFTFNIAQSNANQAAGVDIYGLTGKGHSFEVTTVYPSGPNEIQIDTSVKRCRAKIPFAIGNTGASGAGTAAAGTEFKCGFTLPATAAILDEYHGLGIVVTTRQSGKTVEWGILSTDTGGAQAGFSGAITLNPTSPALQVAGSDGSLFSSNLPYLTDSETGGAANGLDLSYTLSSGTTTGAGFIILPYQLNGVSS